MQTYKYMPRRHWTPLYVKDRLREAAWRRMNPEAPWLNRTAVHVFSELLLTTDMGVEFGSGRSTEWIASRVRHIVSVEHDREWYEWVRTSLSDAKNADVRLSLGRSTANVLELLHDVSDVDFVLVDGSQRSETALWAIEHVKVGGFIIVDDAHRYLPSHMPVPGAIPAGGTPLPEWEEFMETVHGWRTIWTHDGVASSLFLIVP